MKISEENVIRELQRKNPSALEYIIKKYGKNIYTLVSNVLKDICNQEDIKECTSDVFYAVWENSSRYNPQKGSLKTWVLILAKYKALDYRRKTYKNRKLRKTEEIEEIPSQDNVEINVIVQEEIKEVLSVVDSLKEIDQQIFYKRYFYYEDTKTIANSLGITPGAVDNRLYRIRKKLKETVKGCECE